MDQLVDRPFRYPFRKHIYQLVHRPLHYQVIHRSVSRPSPSGNKNITWKASLLSSRQVTDR